jgi:hypothetical protein
MTVVNAMQPSSSFTVPPSWERKILLRWRELEPRVKLSLHHSYPGNDIEPRLETERLIHRQWLLTLLHRRIDMRQVRRGMMDDVTREPKELQAEMERYILKRQRRKPNANKS